MMKFERVVLYDVYLGQDKVNDYPMHYNEIKKEFGNSHILDKHGFKLIPSAFFMKEVYYETDELS